MRINSLNSRIFDKAEQKMSTLQKEMGGIVSALQTYEHYIIGSHFPIHLYCDHKPMLHLMGTQETIISPLLSISGYDNEVSGN